MSHWAAWIRPTPRIRDRVAGKLPLRLAPAVLQEQHDGWQDGRRHFSQASLGLLRGDGPAAITNPLTAGLAA